MFMARCCIGMPKVYAPDFKTREALSPPKMGALEMKAVKAGVPWNKIHIVAAEDASAAQTEAAAGAAAASPPDLARTVSAMPAADAGLLSELEAMAWPDGFRRNLARRALRACASSRCAYGLALHRALAGADPRRSLSFSFSPAPLITAPRSHTHSTFALRVPLALRHFFYVPLYFTRILLTV